MPGKSCSPGTGGRERQQRRDSAEGTFSVLRAVQAHPFLRMRIVLKHSKSCVRAEPGLGQEWLEEIRVRGTDSVQAGGQPDTSTAASQLLHQADGKKNATPTLRNHVFFPPLRSERVSERAPRGPSRAVGFGDSFLMAGVSCVLKGCFTSRLSFAEAASGHLETQHKHVTARKCIRKHHCSQNQTSPGSHQSTTHTSRPPGDACGDIQAFPRPGPGRGREMRCSTPATSSGDGDETPLPAPEAVQRRIFATEMMPGGAR